MYIICLTSLIIDKIYKVKDKYFVHYFPNLYVYIVSFLNIGIYLFFRWRKISIACKTMWMKMGNDLEEKEKKTKKKNCKKDEEKKKEDIEEKIKEEDRGNEEETGWEQEEKRRRGIAWRTRRGRFKKGAGAVFLKSMF